MPTIHATQDANNEEGSSDARNDTRTGPPDDSEDDSQLEINIQKLFENLTAYFSRRRRESTRGMMGIHRREYIVKGNDPSNYEERFPEDKEHEELGPTARVWRTYLEECAAYDMERVEGWRDGLDVLLVFAGLFSAVVTTFVAQTSQSLQVDNSAVTASLLFELINVQRAAGNGSSVNDVPRSGLTPFSDFHPTGSDSWVNGLWFVSLSLSLTTALFAVLTKQWIHQYMSVPSGTPRDRCRVRHFRYMGLERWRVDLIIGMLPVLMSLSLGVFLAGLVLFLIPLRVPIASAVGSIAFTSFAAYFITNFLPVIYPSCPYRTPLVQYMFPIYSSANRLHDWIISRFFNCGHPGKAETEKATGHTKEASGTVLAQPVRSSRAAEHAAVGLSADDIDLYALSWLFEISSNPSVHNLVVHSLSALPLRSVNALKSQVASARHQLMDSLMYRLEQSALGPVIHKLLTSLRDDKRDDPFIKRELSRYIRIYLRFAATPGLMFYLPSVENMLPPGTFAALQSVEIIYRQDAELRASLADRVITALTEKEDSTNESQLRLQPIVWASILRMLHYLHTLGLSINVTLLLNEIPTAFWHPMFPPPPLVFTSGALNRTLWKHMEPDSEIASNLTGLKISSPSPRVDKPVPLCVAIRTCLYQYVFETIIQGHADIRNIRDSIDYLGPTDEFSEPPQDPKLCFLLKTASSPSVWDMPKVTYGDPDYPFRYSCTFVSRVLLNIGVHLDVHKFSLIDKNIPSFGLDVNRPWLLGRVCHRWRDISRNYPALWSSFDLMDLQLGGKQLAQEIRLRMFREVLQRTRQSGLTMTLWIRDSFPAAIIETLMQHSRQWEDVSLLFTSSRQWSQLIFHSPPLQFPLLRSLSLCFQGSQDDLVATLGLFTNAPSLRSLELNVKIPPFDMSMIPFPWSHITHLTMSFAKFSHTELIVTLLQLCPSLEGLTDWTLLLGGRDPDVATAASLTLSKLRSLSLISHLLLRDLTCPVLEYLSFTMLHAEYPSLNLTITHFFACSGSQLQSLKLWLPQNALGPDQLFSYIPQLRKLVLHLADSDNDSDPARFLKGLSGEGGVVLQSLSVLELSAMNLFTDDIRLEGRDELLVRIIERRWNVPRDSQVTRLSHVRVRARNPITRVGDQVSPTPMVLSRIDHLKSFKAEGLDISIIIDEEIEDTLWEERVLL